MAVRIDSIWRRVSRRDRGEAKPAATDGESPRRAIVPPIDISPDDPLLARVQGVSGAVEIDRIELDSPALRQLKASGVVLVVPLVSQGELVGLLNLGPRRSEQEYSADDRALLSNLGAQAGPAVRVAQLVRQQQEEIAERQRIEQELRVAQLIQRTLLPRELPAIPGWRIARHYQPAREVGGDFYDFLPLADGRLGLVIGDVTDKGVPAALVMATTRTLLRAASERLTSPGKVLARVNDLLCGDIPPNMFVTCLYAILDPTSGRLVFANAGHDLPYRRCLGGAVELRATGMPLGLMPGMSYEEREATLLPGDSVLFYSDGLVEAHNPAREMFSFGRLQNLIAAHPGGPSLVAYLLDQLAAFTGPGWEQEDDVTLVVLERQERGGSSMSSAEMSSERSSGRSSERSSEPRPARVAGAADGGPWRLLDEFSAPSEAGTERAVAERVAAATRGLGLTSAQLDRLRTAVAEATMNAMEHGNQFRADLPVTVRIRAAEDALAVAIADRGRDRPIPDPQIPDLEAKLAGLQTPRGWGLFLIKNMVDDLRITADGDHHTVELILHLGGKRDGDETA
jgi:serine phosphatase RsbU (regulator of sigma subunit)/anti-sigma regulatory factor (Ser/Thr protein kinase)